MFQLHKHPAKTRFRRLVVASRIVNDWNGFPSEVVCAPSPNAFKAKLDEHKAHIRSTIPDSGVSQVRSHELDENGYHRPRYLKIPKPCGKVSRYHSLLD